MKTTLLCIMVLLGTMTPRPLTALEILPNELPEHISIYASLYLAERLGPNLLHESVEFVGGRGPRGEERSFWLKFDYSPPRFPQESVRFEVVVTWAGDCKMASRSEFPACSEAPHSCEVNVSSGDARRVARENGLSPGIKDWEVELKYMSQFEGLVWTVSNTTGRISQGYRGKIAIIRAGNGKFLEMWGWKKQA